MTDNKLYFIHFSDIHLVRGSGGRYDLDNDLRREIISDVTRMKDKLGNVNVSGILVSGDIAFSGKQEEYRIAEEFLTELCNIFELPLAYVWCTPGNHDVDQSVIKNSPNLQGIHENFENENPDNLHTRIMGYMEDPTSQDVIYYPLTNYNKFTSRLSCQIDHKNPTWSNDFMLNDQSTLRIHGLNSTIISSHLDSDTRMMILGEHQVPENEEGVINMIICHHPFDCWKDSDRVKNKLATRVKIQLYGHKHSQNISVRDDSLIISSGAAHPSRIEKDWIPRYNWLSVSVENSAARTLNVEIFPRVLDDKGDKFISDHNNCNGNESVEYKLQLPAWCRKENISTASQIEIEYNHTNTVQTKTQKMNEPHKIRKITMDPKRVLTYRFFGLSHLSRLNLIQELGLLLDEDEGLDDINIFAKALERAQKENLIAQLWEKIESKYSDGKYPTNPYGK